MINQTTLDLAPDGTAWKTVKMQGYWKKTKLGAIYGDNPYKLTIVKADGTAFDFYINCIPEQLEAFGEADSTGLVVDKALLANLLAFNWQSDTAENYEATRNGTGGW
jgi:hypothetical protein